MVNSPKNSRRDFDGRVWVASLLIVATGLMSLGFAQIRTFKELQDDEDGAPAQNAQQLAQVKNFQDLLDGGLAPQSSGKAEFSASLSPSDAKPGDEVTLSVTAKLPPQSYIYATTGDFEQRTQITITSSVGLEPIDEAFQADRNPEVALDPFLNQPLSKFHGDVTWSKKFRVDPKAEPGKVSIDLQLEGQYCSEGAGGQCTPIRPPALLHASLSDPVFRYTKHRGEPRDKNPDELRFVLAPTKSSDGKIVKLAITLSMDKDWHTFPMNFDGEGAYPTSFSLENVYGLKPIGDDFKPDRNAENEVIGTFTLPTYHDQVTWTHEFEVLPNFPANAFGVEGKIKYQVCKSQCILHTVKFSLGVTSAEVVPPAHVDYFDEQTSAHVAAPQPQDKGLLVFILTAIGAGLVALLTPCVFPMVPITVSFFLKQNEIKGGRSIALALVFSASIVAAFVIIGVGIAAIFGATKPNELANNWILNLFLATIFFAFALNMLGLFEIQVPSWMLSMTSSGEQAGGYIGVVFMALTFVLTSFSCTFAFVGSLLAAAAQGQYYWPILGMLAFGATFAMPFLCLALMPGLLKSLPKSGGWLNAVKVVMGFVEAGVAVKYISIVDQQWNSVPWLFDFTNVMALWSVLSICTGLYLLGQFRLSHDSPTQGLSPVRVMLAMAFLVLGGLFAVGLTQPDRDAWLLDQLIAFAPAQLNNEEFETDFDRGVAEASRENKPLFIDFTGVFCTNCRLMEKKMAKSQNHSRLKRCALVQLYTDKVPNISDVAEAKRLLERNMALQKDWLNDVSLPAYVVATPDGKTILATFFGLEQRRGDFAKFLDEGWEKWQSTQGGKLSQAERSNPR